MTHLERLCAALIIIFLSLAFGYLAKSLLEKHGANLEKAAFFRKKAQSFAIFILLPFSAMLSLWGLPNPRPELLSLPLLGLASYIGGGLMALLCGRLMRMTRIQAGSLYCCGSFTNLGAVGGLVCLLFLGENAIALVALYRLLEEIFYFGVAFPVAAAHQPAEVKALSQRGRVINPFLGAIVIALACGITLNLLDVPRPAFMGMAASISMLLATIIFLFAIGLTLHLSRVGPYWKAGLAMCAIKYAGSPLLIIPLAIFFGLGGLENGLPLKTAAILSCMPVAMTALVPPSLFDLDVDLANACWIITTAGLAVALPALMFLLPHL